MKSSIIVATAGWNIPAGSRADFPATGTHLERYAQTLPGVEINSTFYRPHRPKTFERWAAGTPRDFRFAVKMPREITHQRRLADSQQPLHKFLSEVAHLGAKLGPLLVQLPPSLAFSKKTATGFLDLLRERFTGDIALEPRHASWFCTDVEEQLRKRKIARVKADPAEPSGAARPGGWHGFMYYRLHGSPRTYWSDYSTGDLERIAQEIIARREEGARVWCVFDNTAEGFAAANALTLKKALGRYSR